MILLAILGAYVLMPFALGIVGLAVIPFLWVGFITIGPVLVAYLLGKKSRKEKKKEEEGK